MILSIIIIKAGFQTTIQDLGRIGFKRFGVPESGCMDRFSARLANILCGNNENDAVLEMLLHGVEMLTLEPFLLVFSGGGAQPVINNQLIPLNQPVYVPANSTIFTLPATEGMRLYMAIAGGFNIPKIMGSRSTYLPACAGSKFVAGNVLKAGCSSGLSKTICKKILIQENSIAIAKWGVLSNSLALQSSTLKIIEGVEWHKFSEKAHKNFLNESYCIMPQSNRMGFRLKGELLPLIENFEMISTAVTRGTIQVTPDGNPLILMADGQTTGGYPRIGQVVDADIDKLAQIRPGKSIFFKLITLENAIKNLVYCENFFKQLERNISIIFN